MDDIIPELLTKNDFSSPILFKLYKYMRILHRNGFVKQPIRDFFTERELKTIIDTLRNCQNDSEFTEKFKQGICEDISLSKYIENRRISRTFKPSFINKNTNEIFKYLFPNKPTEGEIDVLECLLYNYAIEVFEPTNDSELGFDGEGLSASFKKKELQLAKMNELFCNMGNRLNERKATTINNALTTSMYRTDSTGNKIYEDIPTNLVTDFLGGKRKTKRRRKSRRRKNKKRRTNKRR